jgi:chaperonin GroES
MQERTAFVDSATGLETAPILTAANVAAVHEPDTQHPSAVTVDKLALLHDYVVVRPLAVPAKKAGGLLHLPEASSERERSHRGIVLAVGPGDWNEPGTARVPMSIAPGDLAFFGKYSGTEEEVGGHTVLVMRESEIRLRVQAGAFAIVVHDNPKLDHLVEDWCEVCHGVPLEQAAAERLALEREQLLVGKKPGADVYVVDSAEPPTLEEANRVIADINANIRLTPGSPTPLPFVTEGPLDRRSCAGADGTCLFMQQKFETATGPIWLGIRCRHWHQALSL